MAGWGREGVAVALSTFILLLTYYRASAPSFSTYFGSHFNAHPLSGALPTLWWFTASGVLYACVPVVVWALAGWPFTRHFGLGLGKPRLGLWLSMAFITFMLPLASWAHAQGWFDGQYPLAGTGAHTWGHGAAARRSWAVFAGYEFAYLLYFVAWEFHFRGFLLNALIPRFGEAGALLFTVAPFAVMHVGKAEMEAYGAIVAAFALGVLALRTRSIWYGVAVHASVAIWMDVLSSWRYLAAP